MRVFKDDEKQWQIITDNELASESHWIVDAIDEALNDFDTKKIQAISTVELNVTNHVDGRALSLLRKIKENENFTGRVVIKGDVLPDQAMHYAILGATDFIVENRETASTFVEELNLAGTRNFYRNQLSL